MGKIPNLIGKLLRGGVWTDRLAAVFILLSPQLCPVSEHPFTHVCVNLCFSKVIWKLVNVSENFLLLHLFWQLHSEWFCAAAPILRVQILAESSVANTRSPKLEFAAHNQRILRSYSVCISSHCCHLLTWDTLPTNRIRYSYCLWPKIWMPIFRERKPKVGPNSGSKTSSLFNNSHFPFANVG